MDGAGFGFLGGHTAFEKNFLGLLIDGGLDGASPLGGTKSRHAISSRRPANDGGSNEGAYALRKEVERGNGEGLGGGIKLRTKALVLGLIHNARHLCLVLLGLSGAVTGDVLVKAPRPGGNGVLRAEGRSRIGYSPHDAARELDGDIGNRAEKGLLFLGLVLLS